MYSKASESDEHAPNGVSLDKDNVHHLTWLYNRALSRAGQFGIAGVTFNLTMQVVKHIIPAIASTNALISACCVNEAMKLRSGCSFTLDNYFMYFGAEPTGTNTETFRYDRNPSCSVCHKPHVYNLGEQATVQSFIYHLEKDLGMNRPSLLCGGRTIYLSTMHGEYAENLSKPIKEFIAEPNDRVLATDRNGTTTKCILHFN